ncbi:hypothetical protein [Lentzea aerocolonigenes]|uniref:hypothetical protein n=1 Tax=Lentzea aerocolonigenes TaxID=68170 RepID=UPI0004C413BC|nr:hypothetical protein [Lentzea aerocolonigenes]MCP2241964.1 hypothetical protein [Lentzea aerocolonigenes]
MLPFTRRALVVAAVAAAVLGTPGLAQASSPSVQLELCNTRPESGEFEITGRNQHDTRVSSPILIISGGGCRLFANWWWKTSQTVSVAARRGGSLSGVSFTISSAERNGSTVTYPVG